MSRKWDERAEAFDRENPHVMEALRTIALRSVNAGRRRLSINECFEVFRHEHGIRTRGDEFKINNSFRAWYARRLMESTPKLAGMFEIRGGGVTGIADGMTATTPQVRPSTAYPDDEWEQAA